MNLSETHENFDKVKNIILYLQNVIYRWGCSKKNEMSFCLSKNKRSKLDLSFSQDAEDERERFKPRNAHLHSCELAWHNVVGCTVHCSYFRVVVKR